MGSRRDGNNTFLFLIFWGYTVWHLVTWKRVPRCTGLVGRARPVLFSAGGLTGNYYKPTIRDTRADPAEPRRTLDDMESPAAPTDCRVATRLPAATPPPLEMAATDIILAAMDEAAIPAPVKPMAPSTVGTASTATAAMGKELLRGG